MSSNAAVITPVELNKNLLNTLFKFQPLSKLKRFLISKTGVEKTYYSLAEILTILKDVIRGEGMFDEANPSVILCSEDLEEALNMRALHVTEIRDLVLSHITKVPDQSLREKFTQAINICRANTINVARNQPYSQVPAPVLPPRIIRTANISTAVFTDKNAKFTLKPKFLKVVRTVPGNDPDKIVFTYEEVTLLLSKYILSRKDKIFDPRNIKLALVATDPIGEAFGVKAFHRCQVNNLLRSQLIPANNCRAPDEAIVTSSSSPGVNVLVTEKPVPIVSARGVAGTPHVISSSQNGSGNSFGSLPAFPALSKAHSMPAILKADGRYQQNERTRKRTSSGDEDVETKSKQARVAGQTSQCSVVVRPANDSDVSTDTETIYSEQGYETIKVADQTQTSDSEDGDTSRNYHDVEYDIESGEEEERPPQAMGMGQDFSSADDTDTDVDEDMKLDERVKIDVEAGAIAHMLESVYWGDSEDDVKMSKSDEKELDSFDSELDNSDIWKCISCKTPNKPYIRYCAKCWSVRKGWVGEHKRKTRPASTSPRKTLIHAMDSDTETDGASRPRFDSKASICSQDSGIGSQEFEISTQEEEASTKEIQRSSLVVNHSELIHESKFSRSISLDLTSEKSISGASSMELGDCASTSNLKDFPCSPSASDSGCFSSMDSGQGTSQLCLMCCQRPKNASLIHGRLGHQVCCYPCAKKLWKKQARCPVCRRKVERIVKLIQA
eukprot:GFUD01029108.1.p1 GENE.GFUD01029108.1~~GFUD01029108.1.p1  ORF type:complete len:726 (+),score=117.49 GFUD01029108.1:126-2303(+)